MEESIGFYRDVTQRLEKSGNLDDVAGLNKDNKLRALEPVKRPSNWIRFKAALGKVPLLARAGSLQRARAEVTKYRVYKDLEISSRQFMAGFVQALRKEYGAEYADLALKDVKVKRDQLFTSRVAKAALAQVEKARQAANNANALRFMEAPLQKGSRASGEKSPESMNDVFRERDLLTSEGSWKDAVGEDAAAMIRKMVQVQVRGHDLYSRNLVPNGFLQEAANKAIDLYLKVKSEAEELDVPEEVVNSAFKSAAQGSSIQGGVDRAREKLLDHFVSKMLDRHDSESTLSAAVTEEAEFRGLDPLPAEVVKSIASGTLDFLRLGYGALPDELGTEKDAPAIWKKLEGELTARITGQVAEHYDALAMIQESDTLSPNEKEILLEIAAARRMDATQVRAYEHGAATLRLRVPELIEGLKSREFDRVIEALGEVKHTLERYMDDMRTEAGAMWNSGILGGDMNVVLGREMLKLALADLSREDTQELFNTLASEEGRQACQGFLNAAKGPEFGWLAVTYKYVTEAVGAQAGLSSNEIDSAIDKLGEPIEPRELPPHLLMITAGAQKNYEGIVSGARYAADSVVASNVLKPNQIASDTVEHLMKSGIDEKTGLSKAFVDSIGRSTFTLNHKLLADVGHQDKDQAIHAFMEAFRTEKGIDEAAARAVSFAFNQDNIQRFFDSAFQKGLRGVGEAEHQRSSLEAWKADNGDWLVRATHAATISTAQEKDGTSVALKEPGHIAYSVTYRISAESIASGQPTIKVANVNRMFDF